ncbi:PREDICTED: uncharacterized protein LOC107073305 [Polistes dominula]|uniref:Uncharacterized protein LOC107073305 n=1 Tax=Polistes dominula TaxID=743375 RepID=A0ABM1JA93_POLDO|nr:PREDICTED: uncharacterized protein LOC107073305 [Polistes dominula]
MFTSSQQNKDLCELKSNTCNSISRENNNNTDNIVNLFNNSVTFKTALKNHKNNGDEKIRINSIFSFVCDDENLNSVSRTLPRLENVQNVEEHYCGVLDSKCKFCGALHFPDEANREGLFKSCCHFGKVKLQRTKKYPEMLQSLMAGENDLSKNFKTIRSYNSTLSFASMGADTETISNGPYCFKIHGQKYSQLYVLDTEIATDIRLQNGSNFKCDRTLMKDLDVLLGEVNPYSNSFKNMGEVINEQVSAGNEVKDLGLFFRKNLLRDQRRYNNPRANEIAIVFTDSNGEPPFERDIKVYNRSDAYNYTRLNILSPHLDPMTYAIFFPHGESGWEPNLALRSYTGEFNTISLLQYKIAQLKIKSGVFNPLLHGGKLLQQGAVDSYLQVEANNLNFIKLNQKKLRVDYYKGLVDYVNNNSTDTSRPILLPSTFQGSPRNMRERYHDAMAIVTKYGKPDLFITMTCNPNWKEIKENLFKGQTPFDRPDLVAKVFHLKLKVVMDDILSGKVFGEVVAHIYSIEFQKRGLPYAHILVILKSKINSIKQIGNFVSAEIPDKTD